MSDMSENGDQQIPPLKTNKEIVDAIKDGKLGPVVRLDNISEAEKNRIAKVMAEEELDHLQDEVFSGKYKHALLLNLSELAEKFERMAFVDKDKTQEMHMHMQRAHSLRVVASLIRQLEIKPKQPLSAN